MYKIYETSEGRTTTTDIRTKAEALKEMRRRARINQKVYGIRSSIAVYKDDTCIDCRRTYGSKYAR